MINKNTIFIKALLLAFLAITVIQAQTSLQNKYRLANSFERAGDIEKAKEIYEELTDLQPDNATYVRALNNIYLQLKEYPESIELLNKAIIKSPKNIDFYGMLGSTYYIRGEEDRAFEIWDEAVENFPGQNSRYRTISGFAIQNRALDKAIEILLKGKENSKEPVMFSYDLANLYSATMKFEKAAEEYAYALNQQPQQLFMIRSRINNYIFSRDAFEPTVKVFEAAYNKGGNIVLLDMLSYLYRQQGDFKKAFDRVKELDAKTENNGAKIFSFAQDSYREGNFEVASKGYKYVLENIANSALATASKLGFARSEEARLDKKIEAVRPDWKIKLNPEDYNNADYEKILKIYEELSTLKSEPELANEAVFREGMILKNNLEDLKCRQIQIFFFDRKVADFGAGAALSA